MKTGLERDDREIVNICPIKLIPQEFARYNLYVLMAKSFRFTPTEVDCLTQKHLTYFLAGMEAESLIQKVMMKDAENRRGKGRTKSKRR